MSSQPEKKVQDLVAGDRISFHQGEDETPRTGVVRRISVLGKYVDVWFHTELGELSLVLAEVDETVSIV
jgi:hypothetical protein